MSAAISPAVLCVILIIPVSSAMRIVHSGWTRIIVGMGIASLTMTQVPLIFVYYVNVNVK